MRVTMIFALGVLLLLAACETDSTLERVILNPQDFLGKEVAVVARFTGGMWGVPMSGTLEDKNGYKIYVRHNGVNNIYSEKTYRMTGTIEAIETCRCQYTENRTKTDMGRVTTKDLGPYDVAGNPWESRLPVAECEQPDTTKSATYMEGLLTEVTITHRFCINPETWIYLNATESRVD